MASEEENSAASESFKTDAPPRYLAVFGVYLFVISYLFLVMPQIGMFVYSGTPFRITELLVGILLVEVGIVLLPFAVRYSASKVVRMRLFIIGLIVIGLSFIMMMVPYPDPNFGYPMQQLFISTAMIGFTLMEISLLLSLFSINTFDGKTIGVGTTILGLIVVSTWFIPLPSPYSSLLFLKYIASPVGIILMLVGISMVYGTCSN